MISITLWGKMTIKFRYCPEIRAYEYVGTVDPDEITMKDWEYINNNFSLFVVD